jgi:hypothetical protein
VHEAGWDTGPIWTSAENLSPTGIRSPDRPTRSESLYRLRCPGPHCSFFRFLKSRALLGQRNEYEPLKEDPVPWGCLVTQLVGRMRAKEIVWNRVLWPLFHFIIEGHKPEFRTIVSHRLFNTETGVQSHGISCAICDGQSGVGVIIPSNSV